MAFENGFILTATILFGLMMIINKGVRIFFKNLLKAIKAPFVIIGSVKLTV